MGHRTLAGGVLLALAAGFAGPHGAAAQDARPPSNAMPSAVALHPPFLFDIPVQPLAAALEQFGARTGLPVVFDAALVQGRQSAMLRGDYDALTALRLMLEGTGLDAQYARPDRTDALVVVRPPSSRNDGMLARPELPAPPAPGVAHRRYDGLMQTRIRETFCSHPLLARGGYRAALQFNVDATGRVRGAQVLDTSGDRLRDAAMAATLEGMQLDWSPPPTMAQPVTMVIQPRAAALCPTVP